MFAAIEVSTHSTRKGAALHLRGCGWSRYLPVVQTVELTAKNAHRACKNCRKAIRAAIAEAARQLRAAARNVYTATRDAALIVLGELFATDAEKARQAELVERLRGSAFARELAPTAPRPTLASVLAGFGTDHNAPLIAKAKARAARTHTLAA